MRIVPTITIAGAYSTPYPLNVMLAALVPLLVRHLWLRCRPTQDLFVLVAFWLCDSASGRR